MATARPPPTRPWRLGPDGRTVTFGDRSVLLAAVAGVEIAEIYEPNVIGHLMAVGLFLLGGAMFVMPVALTVARPKFLLGGALFITIGVTALVEIFRSRAMHLHRLDISLKSGETVQFTSDQRAEVEALSAVLSIHCR